MGAKNIFIHAVNLREARADNALSKDLKGVSARSCRAVMNSLYRTRCGAPRVRNCLTRGSGGGMRCNRRYLVGVDGVMRVAEITPIDLMERERLIRRKGDAKAVISNVELCNRKIL